MDISKRKSCFNVKSSAYYFHVKTKILSDLHIYVTVPLKTQNNEVSPAKNMGLDFKLSDILLM